jgi:lipopolysaccharide export system protein LptA
LRRAPALGALLVALVPFAAAAQLGGLAGSDQDKGKPVEIEAERGIEWQQNTQVYIARGKAKVSRGGVTLYGETINAYYRPSAKKAAQPAPEQPKTETGTGIGGGTEIYRVVAEGDVRIATATQTVYGDRAVYDLDQALVVVTGKNLRLETPTDLVTARDSLEWYDEKQLAVARGDAVAIREAKRVRGDVLVAQVVRPPGEASRISRVDAHGNVVVTTLNEIARGATGVYNADTGIATLSGNVTLTRGENEMKGQYGVVDLNNNVSRLLAGPPGEGPAGGRVQGLLVPGSSEAKSGGAAPAEGEAAEPAKTGPKKRERKQ